MNRFFRLTRSGAVVSGERREEGRSRLPSLHPGQFPPAARLLVMAAALCSLPPAPLPAEPSPGVVTTVAGYGIRGRSHNDLNLASPGLAATDDEGGIYFPDTDNHIVYNRDDWNILAPLAGNGLPGFSGDGGPPLEARLNRPKGVAVRGGSRVNDPDQFPEIDPNKPVSVVYIADTGNRRIRKIYRDPTRNEDVIVTVAGGGSPQFKGDGGPALGAGFVSPEGLALDSAGALYVADRLDHRVRRIDPDGTVHTVAGTGVPGFGGDGGPAGAAQLHEPGVVLVGRDDALYISDTKNHRIRRVKDGVISTFIGGGLRVEDGGLPAEMAIQLPTGMAVDGDGAFFFVDGLRVRVLRAGPSLFNPKQIQNYGSFVTALRDPQNPVSAHLAGQFSPEMKRMLDEYDVEGFPPEEFKAALVAALNAILQGPNLYDAARFSNVALSDEAKALLAQNPQGEALLRLNRMLVDEAYPQDLARNLMDGKVHTYAGSGAEGFLGENGFPQEASFRRPYGLTVPTVERLLITDDVARRVRAVDGSSEDNLYILTVFGKNLWDDTPARSSRVTLPVAVVPGPEGRALIADTGNRRIRSLAPPCSETLPRQPYYLYSVAGKGIPASGGGSGCRGLNTLPASYGPTADGSKALEAEIAPPTGVAGTPGGVYYFSEGEKKRVWQVDAGGLLRAVNVPGGLAYPAGLALAPDGRLFIVDRDAARVWVKDPRLAGPNDTVLFAGTEPGDGGDGGPATLARLNAPEAVAVGPDGSVYIADTGNHRVKRVGPDGILRTVAGTGTPGLAPPGPAESAPLHAPRGVAVDADGTLYIADTGNHRIVRVKGGLLEPVSGGPEPGRPLSDPLSREDLDEWAGETSWYEPAGLAFDAAGNLFVADSHNHRIRVIHKAAAARFGADPARIYGDVNDDRAVNVSDAVDVLKYTVGLAPLSVMQIRRADVAPQGLPGLPPGDGRVDVADAIRILRRGVGLIPDGEWP